MPLRHFARIWDAPSAIALALVLVQPVIAAEAPGMPGDSPVTADLPLHTPQLPAPPPPASVPDMRPVWHDSGILAPAAAGIDPRAREAWLWECRRRTAHYYDDGRQYGRRRHHRANDDGGLRPAYDYCEAYLDDFYRAYAQPGYGLNHGHPGQIFVQPVAMAPTQIQQDCQPCEEETEEYVPVRTRAILPRRRGYRPLPDKRIRVN